MSHINRFLCFLSRPALTWIFLLLASRASAQFTITDVVNAASRFPSGRPNSGIAQGALFAVTGRGVGPSQTMRASFPLPTTEGLGGVTLQVAVSGQIVDAMLVSVAPNEVDAILPSSTPLGNGTLTLNNNGAKATKAITVVSVAFGIFTQAPVSGQAVAFNLSADVSTAANGIAQSIQPGADLLISGTGLGAISSDETQSGLTDAPNTPPDLKVYVGVIQATVVSGGRGDCCDGLDPAYRVQRGIAAGT